MIGTLFIKEIREAFASRRIWVVLVLCFVLVPLGVEVRLKDYQTRWQNYREAVRVYQEEIRTIADMDIKGGAKAFAPPSPLSFISMGLELVKPNLAETPIFFVMPPAITTFSNNQARDSLYELFYGPLDLVFIVGVVMTFIAVIMTHGAIAGEKERGSLRQILSNSVPRAKIIFAKTAAHWLLLIIPFMAAITLGLIILEIQSGPTLVNGSAWTFIGLAVLLSALLVGVFFNLGLLISASTKQSVSALVTLLLVWVLAYGLYPRLASGIAQLIYPVKSEARLSLDKDLVRRNIEKLQNAEIDAVVQTMPDDYESPAYKDAEKKQDEIGARYRAQLERTWQLIEREAEARREARLALATNIARLSPVSCFVRPLAELARTGWLEYKQFDTQVRQYEEVLNREIFDKRKVYRSKQGSSFDDDLNFEVPAPVFTYSHVPIESVVEDILPDLTLLILFNLVLFAGAFVAFIRYDVR